MKHVLKLSAFAVSACLLASPSSGSIQVVGSSPGYSCYKSAVARESSPQALASCDQAFATGMLTRQDELATYVNRGIVKMWAGRNSDAIADFDRAMDLNPARPEPYINKGTALLRAKESPEQAITLYDEALRRSPRDPGVAYFGRAVAHEISGDLKAAYLDYRRAQQASPQWDLPARELSRFTVRRASGSSL